MQFQDKHTLRYVPGRLYEKTGVKKAAYLREEREGAVLNSILNIPFHWICLKFSISDLRMDTLIERAAQAYLVS